MSEQENPDVIENKNRNMQEQEALEYEFKLLKESKEAERKRIAANGRNKTIKKYNGDIFWKKIFKQINFS